MLEWVECRSPVWPRRHTLSTIQAADVERKCTEVKITSMILATLICSVIISNQENQSSQGQQIVLDTPEVISLKLAPVTRRASAGVYKQASGPFTPESKIKFALVATNNSLVPLPVRSWDQFAQNRPRLLRDNQEVPYRDSLTDLLKKKDNDTGGEIVSIVVITLAPNTERTLEQIDLSNWYEPLQPGYYQLSTQHRFVQGGKWVDSASIAFEVQRKK